ncbi:peptidylprolyl isomerase [[Clostridium] polysaccharolyticum]|uniref:peptidylprolyl isomerase n=1 Tax=[Clostridium] polysaccharolyticum TaxID=29364 RepID=A0A1H9YSU9_9FIRM|nr:peptidylprolyl isomerase [[Clostridium] polysaccharolyticum]SES72240.1 PPIC-type PPIASE domain-containing protein [[Clostridium] polysaccharolyticum]
MSFKKKISYVLILALCLLQITGCKKKADRPDNSSVEVFTINRQQVFLDQVLYKVWESEQENSYYSRDYQKQYGEAYWDSEIIKGTTVRENLKEQLYDDIIRDVLLYQKAVEEGYVLTKNQKDICHEQADVEWKDMSSDVKKAIGASKSLLIRIKEEKSLIDQFFSDKLNDCQADEKKIRATISQEDYKEIDIQTIGYYKYLYSEDGSETKKSKEENQMGKESLLAIADKAKKAEDFDELLTDDSEPLETESLSIIPGETACDKKIQDTVMTMKPGEVSDVIETDTGYFIVQVLDNTSSDAYEEAVADAVKHEKYKQFDEYFATLKKDADIKTTKQWDNVQVGGTVIKES